MHEVLTPDSIDAARGRLASEVEFRSPVTEYVGRDDVGHLLLAISRVLTDVSSSHEHVTGDRSVSEFRACVDGQSVDGVLVQQLDTAGLLQEVTLVLRPLAALRRAVMRMGEILTTDPLPSERHTPRKT